MTYRALVIGVVLMLLAVALCPRLAVRAEQGGAAAASAESLLPGTIVEVLEERPIEFMGQAQTWQRLLIVVTGGSRRGERVVVEQASYVQGYQQPLSSGQRVWLSVTHDLDGTTVYHVASPARSRALLGLAAAFAFVVLAVGRGRGLRSLGGLVLSFVVIFVYVLPRIAAGASPLGVALVGAGVAMPFSYYLSHGLGRKTTVALIASLVALLFTALLAENMVDAARLTGFATEEASFLLGGGSAVGDIRGLLLAGMIIAVLGVLDDITVAQASVVEQLAQANPAWDWRELYGRAMRVGQDHIASMVNTLVLVYAGAALPLLLLLMDPDLPLGYVLSLEVVAEEVVRTMVTSIGLVAAVPLSTVLAALVMGHRAKHVAGGAGEGLLGT